MFLLFNMEPAKAPLDPPAQVTTLRPRIGRHATRSAVAAKAHREPEEGLVMPCSVGRAQRAPPPPRIFI